MIKKSFFLIAIVALYSCKKGNKFTTFDMDYSTSVTIPSSTGINLPVNVNSPDVETNSEGTFAINDTRKDHIKSIFLNSLQLKLTSPSGEDFSFLESVTIYIKTQKLSEQKIAWKENINETSNVLHLITSNVDFQEYLKEDEFYLRVDRKSVV